MKYFLIALFSGFYILVFGQSKAYEEAAPFIEKGHLLYRCEKSAWLATDLLVSQYPHMEQIGGYLAYTIGDSSSCIFYSNTDTPKVLASVDFDTSFTYENSLYLTLEREFTSLEKKLYSLRKKTIDLLQTDTLIRVYGGTSLNFIPIIHDGKYEVYILTAPKEHGYMIIGNDYLFEYNEELEFQTRNKLHSTVHFFDYYRVDEDGDTLTVTNTMHSHNHTTGPHITATDVCTFLLYGPFSPWKQHQIMSAEYLSTWNIPNKKMDLIMSREVFDKIMDHQEKSDETKTKSDD